MGFVQIWDTGGNYTTVVTHFTPCSALNARKISKKTENDGIESKYHLHILYIRDIAMANPIILSKILSIVKEDSFLYHCYNSVCIRTKWPKIECKWFNKELLIFRRDVWSPPCVLSPTSNTLCTVPIVYVEQFLLCHFVHFKYKTYYWY